MSLSSYVTLGRSGLRVSPFCLGAMTFGEEWGWGASPEVSRDILATYLDRGGNFIDTSNNYTFGHSEAIIGDYFAGAGRRDRAVIATKFVSSLHRGDPNGGGAGRKAMMQQCENSLRRLKTDYIDLYWMHAWDAFTPIEETMRAFDDLVSSGKVRYIGLSDSPAWKVAEAATIARFRGWAPVAAIQIEYSLLQRTVEGELIPMARELELGICNWGPLRGGALSGKFTRATAADATPRRSGMVQPPSERAYQVIDVVEEIARARGASVAAVALSWVRNRPGITAPIIGARTVEHLENNLAALDLMLSAEETARLDQLTNPPLNWPAQLLSGAQNVSMAGATVNGIESVPYPITPPNDEAVY
jgi:aryl-alcohol dehydrogenase-like predicted oxidoreductase